MTNENKKSTNSSDMPSLTQGLSIFQSYQEISAPNIDYNALQMTADYKDLQADALEVQVQQQANVLREQFAEAVGSAQYSAARRGVKVGEGSTQINIEESSMDLGQDIATAKANQKRKSASLKRSAKYLRSSSERQRGMADISRWTSAATKLAGVL